MDVEKRELRVFLDKSSIPIGMKLSSSGKTDKTNYHLSNISRSGMFLEADELEEVDLKLGSSIHFSMNLPHKVKGTATVRWVRPETKGPYLKKGLGLEVKEFNENAESLYLTLLEKSLENLKVVDLMHTNFNAIAANETIRSALETLEKSRQAVILVVDKENKPTGLFRKDCAIAIALNNLPLETKVSEMMDSKFRSVNSCSNIDDVYSLMRYGEVDHLAVIEKEKLVGLISMRDLLPFWSEYMELQTKRISKNYDRVVSVMAHDLRTPISVIKTANYLTEENGMTLEEFIGSGIPDIIDSSCDTMLALIDSILESNNIKHGKLVLKKESLDLEKLVTKIVRCFRVYAASKNIEIAIDIPLAVPKTKVDALRIEQVLNNLLANATKFCANNSRIIVGLGVQNSMIALWVADNGPGIPTKEQKFLFEEFRTGSVRPTAGEKSTGLGLTICKRIIDAHNGSIRIDSKVGKGTTFTILLPLEEIQ